MENSQEIKLSFVVPIYNVKPYLKKCVDSLSHQNYDDYEIILVDDGSTDGSGELADQLTEEFNSCRCGCRSRTFHQANRGLSGARNAGVELAQGEYICFVDSDDYWEENVLGGLMAQIERGNLDVLRFRWQNVRVRREGDEAMGDKAKGYEIFQPYKEENFADFSSETLSGVDYLNQRMGIQCYAWSFILRTSLVKGNEANWREGDEAMGERFTEGILFEDTDWTPRMLVKAQRVAGTETMVYNYLWRENGITLAKNPEKIRKEVEDKIALIGRLNEWGETDWYKVMISALVVSVVNILGDKLYDDRDNYIAALCANGGFPLTMHGLNMKTKRKARIINISPRLAIWLLHIKNKN